MEQAFASVFLVLLFIWLCVRILDSITDKRMAEKWQLKQKEINRLQDGQAQTGLDQQNQGSKNRANGNYDFRDYF